MVAARRAIKQIPQEPPCGRPARTGCPHCRSATAAPAVVFWRKLWTRAQDLINRTMPDNPAPVGQATLQAAPLRVNEAGLPVLPVWLAWKPMLTDPPGAMLPL